MRNNDSPGDPDRLSVPGYFSEEPVFENDAMLNLLNELAKKRNCNIPFPNCKLLPENNGEVFLSEYFEEQQKRNKEGKYKGGFCVCEICAEIGNKTKAKNTGIVSCVQNNNSEVSMMLELVIQ